MLGGFSKPFWNMALSLYTLYYIFTQIGQIAFGGRITIQNSDGFGMFYLMNFNDMGSSIITLFHISIVNNWYVTANMFTQAIGNSWPRVYFVAWWVVSVLVLQNLIIAFVMEIYGQTTEQVDKEFKHREAAQKICQQDKNGEAYDPDALSELDIKGNGSKTENESSDLSESAKADIRSALCRI